MRATAAELVGGIDEAGRGPLAGPVVAAAVVLDPARPIAGLDDSKKLSPRRRAELELLVRRRSLAWSVAMASVEEIDRLNIHHATLLAMRRAALGLRLQPARFLVDGKFVPRLTTPCVAEIGGDGRFACIGAASILAKQARDALMESLHASHPEFGFDSHKGYPTVAHREAIARNGVLPCHRRSFAPIRRALAGGVAEIPG